MTDIQNDLSAGDPNHVIDHNEVHDLVRDLQKGVTKDNLRSTDVAEGDLARVTDDVRGLWMYQGDEWFNPTGQEMILDEHISDYSASDHSTEIQSAIDTLSGLGGGTLKASANRTYLAADIDVKDNVRILGGGWTTVFKRIDASSGRVFLLGLNADAKNVMLQNFKVDGNESTHSAGPNQDHGVFVNAQDTTRASRVTIRDLWVDDTSGDGINVGASPGVDPVQDDITIDGCRTTNTARQGIAITAGQRVRVIACDSDGSLKVEPNEPPEDISIVGNTSDTLSVIANIDARARITVQGNTVLATTGSDSEAGQFGGGADASDIIVSGNAFFGGVRISETNGLTFSSNTMKWLSVNPASGIVARTRIVENAILNEDNGADDPQASVTDNGVVRLSAALHADVEISGNLIVAPDLNGIVVRGCDGLSILGNIILDTAQTATNRGIYLNSGDMNQVDMRGNLISGFDRGIQSESGADHVNGGSVHDNVFTAIRNKHWLLRHWDHVLIEGNRAVGNIGSRVWDSTGPAVVANFYENSSAVDSLIEVNGCTDAAVRANTIMDASHSRTVFNSSSTNTFVDQREVDSVATSGTNSFRTGSILPGNTTWDPGSISDGAVASTTLTVSGTETGDAVVVSHDQLGANDVMLTAHVQGADTVRAVLLNKTGGAFDLASGTLNVEVHKR